MNKDIFISLIEILIDEIESRFHPSNLDRYIAKTIFTDAFRYEVWCASCVNRVLQSDKAARHIQQEQIFEAYCVRCKIQLLADPSIAIIKATIDSILCNKAIYSTREAYNLRYYLTEVKDKEVCTDVQSLIYPLELSEFKQLFKLFVPELPFELLI